LSERNGTMRKTRHDWTARRMTKRKQCSWRWPILMRKPLRRSASATMDPAPHRCGSFACAWTYREEFAARCHIPTAARAGHGSRAQDPDAEPNVPYRRSIGQTLPAGRRAASDRDLGLRGGSHGRPELAQCEERHSTRQRFAARVYCSGSSLLAQLKYVSTNAGSKIARSDHSQ